jgi:hypothetical protein
MRANERWVRAAAVSAAAISIAGLVALVALATSPRARGLIGRGPASGPVIGSRGVDMGVLGAGAPFTAVIFARFDCAGCQLARPFLTAVVEETRKHAGVRAVMATGRPVSPDEIAFASGLGIPPVDVIHVPAGASSISLVPTVVVVDDEGLVVSARVEHVTKGDEHDVARHLFEPVQLVGTR